MIEKANHKNKSPLSKEKFLIWIEHAEKSPIISLETFNKKWEEKMLKIVKTQKL